MVRDAICEREGRSRRERQSLASGHLDIRWRERRTLRFVFFFVVVVVFWDWVMVLSSIDGGDFWMGDCCSGEGWERGYDCFEEETSAGCCFGGMVFGEDGRRGRERDWRIVGWK